MSQLSCSILILVAVIDFLGIEDGVPDAMLRYELISYALEKRWAQGGQGLSDAPRFIWARYDALCTPRYASNSARI